MKKKSSFFAFILVLAIVLSVTCAVWVNADEVTHTLDDGGTTIISSGETNANYVVASKSALVIESGAKLSGDVDVTQGSSLEINGEVLGNISITSGSAVIKTGASVAAITCSDGSLTIEDNATVATLKIAGKGDKIVISDGAIVSKYEVEDFETQLSFSILGTGDTVVDTARKDTKIHGDFSEINSTGAGCYYITFGNNIDMATSPSAVTVTAINGGSAAISGHETKATNVALNLVNQIPKDGGGFDNWSTDANSGLIINGSEDSVFDIYGKDFGNMVISGGAVSMHNITMSGVLSVGGDADVTIDKDFNYSWNFVHLPSGTLTFLEDFMPNEKNGKLKDIESNSKSDLSGEIVFQVKNDTNYKFTGFDIGEKNGNFINKSEHYIPVLGTFNSIGGSRDGEMYTRITVNVKGNNLVIKQGGTGESNPNHLDIRITSSSAYGEVSFAGIRFEEKSFYKIKSVQPDGPARIDIDVKNSDSIIELEDGYFGTVRVKGATLKTTEADGVYRIHGESSAKLFNTKKDWYPNIYGSFDQVEGCATVIGVDACEAEKAAFGNTKVSSDAQTTINSGKGTLKFLANDLHSASQSDSYYDASTSHAAVHHVTNSAVIKNGQFTVVSSSFEAGNSINLTVDDGNAVVTMSALSGSALNFSSINGNQGKIVLDSVVTANDLTINGNSTSGSKQNLVVNVPQDQIGKIVLKGGSLTDICSGASIKNAEISDNAYIALENGNLQGDTIYFETAALTTDTAFKVSSGKQISLLQRADKPVELVAQSDLSSNYTLNLSGKFERITAKGKVEVKTASGKNVEIKNVTAPAVVVNGADASVILGNTSKISTYGDSPAVLVSGGSFGLESSSNIVSSGTAISGKAKTVTLAGVTITSEDEDAIVVTSSAFNISGTTNITGNIINNMTSSDKMTVKASSDLTVTGNLETDGGKVLFEKDARVHVTKDLKLNSSFDSYAKKTTVDEDAEFGGTVVNSGAALLVKGSLLATGQVKNNNSIRVYDNAAFKGGIISTGSEAVLNVNTRGDSQGSEGEALYLDGTSVIENNLFVKTSDKGIYIASNGKVTISVEGTGMMEGSASPEFQANVIALESGSVGIYNKGTLNLIDCDIQVEDDSRSTAVVNYGTLNVGTHNSTAAAIQPAMFGGNGIYSGGTNAKTVIYNATIGSAEHPITNIGVDTQDGADTAIIAYGHSYTDNEADATTVDVYALQKAFNVGIDSRWAIRGNNAHITGISSAAIFTNTTSSSAIALTGCQNTGVAPISGGTYVGQINGVVAIDGAIKTSFEEFAPYIVAGNFYLSYDETSGTTTVRNAEAELRAALEDASGTDLYKLPCDVRLGGNTNEFHGIAGLGNQNDLDVAGEHILDLNGHKLWINGTEDAQVIEIEEGNKLTVINSSGSGLLTNALSSDSIAVLVNGGEFVVSSGAVEASGAAIKVVSNGSLTVEGGTVGNVSVVSGSAVLCDGTIDTLSVGIFDGEFATRTDLKGGNAIVSGAAVTTLVVKDNITVNSGVISEAAVNSRGFATINGGTIGLLTVEGEFTKADIGFATITDLELKNDGKATVSGAAVTTAVVEDLGSGLAVYTGTFGDVLASGSALVTASGGAFSKVTVDSGSAIVNGGTIDALTVEKNGDAELGFATVTDLEVKSGGSATVSGAAVTTAVVEGSATVNAGTIADATVSGSAIVNGGTIDALTVENDGEAELGFATVTDLEVKSGGSATVSGAAVTTAVVEGSATVNTGTIADATVSGSAIVNGGTIDALTVEKDGDAELGFATVTDLEVKSGGNATVSGAAVSTATVEGWLTVNAGTVNDATVSGDALVNGGIINSLTIETSGDAKISNATVTDLDVNIAATASIDHSVINTADIEGSVGISYATITDLDIDDGGDVTVTESAIATATIDGSAEMTLATLTDLTVGTFGEATINGATISTAAIKGEATLNDANIASAVVSGSAVVNGVTFNTLTVEGSAEMTLATLTDLYVGADAEVIITGAALTTIAVDGDITVDGGVVGDAVVSGSAVINGVKFDTLTVAGSADMTLATLTDLYVADGAEVTIDGAELTTAVVEGSLTADNGTIDSALVSGSAIINDVEINKFTVNDEGSADVNDGSIADLKVEADGEVKVSGAAITKALVSGEAKVNAGTIKEAVVSGSAVVNGAVTSSLTVETGGAFTANLGTVTDLTIKDGGEATIKGATVTKAVANGTITADSGLITDLTIEKGANAALNGADVTKAYISGTASANDGTIAYMEVKTSGAATVNGADVTSMKVAGSVAANAGTITYLEVASGATATVNGATVTTALVDGSATANVGTITNLDVNAGGEATVNGATVDTALVKGKLTETAGEIEDLTATGAAALVNLNGGKITGDFVSGGGSTSITDTNFAAGSDITVYGGAVTVESAASTTAAIKADILLKGGSFTAKTGYFDGTFTATDSALATLNAGTRFKSIKNGKSGGKLTDVLASNVAYITVDESSVYERSVYLTENAELTALGGNDYYILKSGNPLDDADVSITKSGSFDFSRVELRDADVTRNVTAVVSFTGEKRQVEWSYTAVPSGSVDSGVSVNDVIKFSKSISESDEQITITIASNAAAGVYTVKAKAVNTSASDTFTITVNKVDISGATFTLNDTDWIPSTWNDGKAITVSALIVNGTSLAKSEYTFAHNCDNTPSDKTFTATATAIGCDFSGAVSTTFRLARKLITDAAVTISGSGQAQDGTDKKVTVTVKYDGVVLTSGACYTVEGTTKAALKGTYNLNVFGIGDYTGKVSKTWTIAEPYTPPYTPPTPSEDRPSAPIIIPVPDVCDGGSRCELRKFSDVLSTAWYHDALHYVFDEHIMNGEDDDFFGLTDSATRGMVVTMFYRLAGEPTVKRLSSFPDVALNEYYAKPIAWAVENGIVSGCDDGKFWPNDAVRREELAVMLYKFAKVSGLSTSKSASIDGFSDYKKVDSWAVDSFKWCVAEGLISGSEGKLLPMENCYRVEVATMFYNLSKLK